MTTALLLQQNINRNIVSALCKQTVLAAAAFRAVNQGTLNSTPTRFINSIATTKKSILFNQQQQQREKINDSRRDLYTFSFYNNTIRYRRATRPRRTNNNSILLNYEQAQFADKIGVTKTWNSWNTSNLLDSKREAESARDDILIRKFIYGTFHELLSSEIIIKRRMNTINIGFLIKLPNTVFVQKVYFLCGYAEELLSCLLKCVVRIQPQSIYHKNDLIFRRW